MKLKEMSAAVLTGGRSSRMGNDKSRLFFDSRRFLEKLTEECRGAGQVLVSVDNKEKYRWFRSEIPFEMAEDQLKGFGPVEGIYQALVHSRFEACLVIAVDMPCLTDEFLEYMAEQYQGEDCLVLTRKGRWEPMCAVYNRRILPVIEKMRRENRRKIGMIYEEVRVRALPLEESGFAEEYVGNINTPADYGKLKNHNMQIKRLEEFCGTVMEKAQENNVLVCYLDGLGYEMYLEADQKFSLKMKKLFDIRPALTVNPPVTNSAMATMITGLSPQEHGILSHRDRKPKVPTFFSKLEENALLLEGDVSILHTEIMPVLHTGGNVDAMIAEYVKKAIMDRVPFIFAHFHQIDDCAHEWGPYGEKTAEQILRMDEWLEQFADSFNGSMFIISDHGLSEKKEGGVHGEEMAAGEGNIQESLIIWGERQCGQN